MSVREEDANVIVMIDVARFLLFLSLLFLFIYDSPSFVVFQVLSVGVHFPLTAARRGAASAGGPCAEVIAHAGCDAVAVVGVLGPLLHCPQRLVPAMDL